MVLDQYMQEYCAGVIIIQLPQQHTAPWSPPWQGSWCSYHGFVTLLNSVAVVSSDFGRGLFSFHHYYIAAINGVQIYHHSLLRREVLKTTLYYTSDHIYKPQYLCQMHDN